MRAGRTGAISVALVFIGGAAGSALRETASLATSGQAHPLRTIIVINVLGALILGALLEWLSEQDLREPTSGFLRCLLGMGLCGGFTTYSTFAVQGADLVSAGEYGKAAAYGLGTVLIGGLATVLGIALGRSVRGWGARGRSRQ